jgi:hypothetical protein
MTEQSFVPRDASRANVLSLHERIARFLQSTTKKKVDRLGQMRSMLGVDVLDSLTRGEERSAMLCIRSSIAEARAQTLRPLSALFPRLKKFSFANRSSCR